MAMTRVKTSDQLVDVLRQIQSRQTVKPEEATKALEQYYKVQEHIKSLKAEIELFKASKDVNNQKQSITTQTGKAQTGKAQTGKAQTNQNSSFTKTLSAQRNSTVATNSRTTQPILPSNQNSSSIKTLSAQRNNTIATNSRTTQPIPSSKQTSSVLNGQEPQSTGPVQQSTGPLKQSTGQVKQSTGPVKQSTGPVKQPTGPVQRSTGQVQQSNGPVKRSSGPVQQSNGPVQRLTGPVQQLNGPVQQSTGLVQRTVGPLHQSNRPEQRSTEHTKSKDLDTKKSTIHSSGNTSQISTATTNVSATNVNKVTKLQTNVSEEKEKSSGKQKENNNKPTINGEDSSKLEVKNGSSETIENERDKELAKLRFQNAQMKVVMDKRDNDALSSRMPPLVEQKYIPKLEKLVDDFRNIYEQEWRVAFHELEKHQRLKEDDITELLAAIAKEAYTFTQVTAQQQFEDICKSHAHVIDVLIQPRYASQVKDVVTSKSKAIMDKDAHQITRKYLKDYRKAMAAVPIPGLIDIFETVVQRDVLARHTSFKVTPKPLRPYMNRLVEVDWFMALSDPQIFQNWPRGGQLMSRDLFIPYSKKGATIIHTVWPALQLNKEGPVADKGVCLVK